MEIEQLDENLLGSGHIFRNLRPPTIREEYWIGFHGTMSANSTRIEEQGLTATKPLSDPDMQFLSTLATELQPPIAENRQDRMLQGLLRDLISFTTSNVVNFFSVSEQALYHTRFPRGQTLQNVLVPSVAAMLAHPALQQGARRTRLMEIQPQLLHFEAGFPVVYAACLRCCPRIGYRRGEMAIQVDGNVAPCCLIAKVQADGFTDHARIRAIANVLRHQADRLAIHQESKHFTHILDARNT